MCVVHIPVSFVLTRLQLVILFILPKCFGALSYQKETDLKLQLLVLNASPDRTAQWALCPPRKPKNKIIYVETGETKRCQNFIPISI